MFRKALIISLLLSLFFSIKVFSQKNKLNCVINYPVIVGNRSMQNEFYGLFDIGLKYNFSKFKNTYVGLSGDMGVIDGKSNKLSGIYTNFCLVAEYYSNKYKLSPFISVGYNLFSFHKQSSSDYENVNNGLIIKPGIKYNLSEKLFINLIYDYSVFFDNNSNGIIDKNVYILRVGLGFRILN